MKLVVANWKTNPATLAEAVRLAKASDYKGVVICAPFIYLEALKRVIKKAALGAQDVSWQSNGAHTGEVSAAQLRALGVKYVIVGHSERRSGLGEDDKIVNAKLKAAVAAGLWPILCVGDDLQTHKRGRTAKKQFVVRQLRAALAGVRKGSRLIVVYEPVWAISTSGTKMKEDAKGATYMIAYVKTLLEKWGMVKVPVIYGGSVGPGNARSFLRQSVIDGVLPGAASLRAPGFKKIVTAAK